jgi:ATP-dependent exoDNAse (exonuclease V) beta subunit
MTYVPIDQNERELAEGQKNVSTSITAGAGTGKTTTIVNRITRALCDEGSELNVGNVAAITFTERAAAELKSRIRKELQRLSDLGNHRATIALTGLEEATIGTIHSFAQRILSRFPIEAGLPIAITLEDEAASKLRVREVASRFAEDLLSSLSEDDSEALYSVGISPLAIRDFYVELNSKRLLVNEDDVLSARQLDPKQEIDSFMSALNEWFASRDSEIAAFTPAFASSIRDNLAILNANYESLSDYSVKGISSLLSPLHTLVTPRTGGNAAKDFKDEMKSLFAGGLDGIAFIPIENMWRRELPNIWRIIQAEIERRYQIGKLTFDDLLVLSVKLLEEHEDVRQVLHDQIKLLVIDEFQDTDQLQWRLATLITSDKNGSGPIPGSLVLVGDAQQSIYSFRGADVGTYLEVRNAVETGKIQAEPRTLSVNFRSNQIVIDWVNKVFDNPATQLGTPFARLTAAEPNFVDEKHLPGVAVIGGPGDEVGVEDEAAYVASAARKAIDDSWMVADKPKMGAPKSFRPAKYSDLAILIPARTSLENLLEELAVRGIPYRSSDSAIVYDRPVVRGLLDAMKSVVGTAEAMDVWFALKSPLFGCDDPELLTYKKLGGRWSLPFGDVDEELAATRVHQCLAKLANIKRTSSTSKPADLMLRIVEESDIRSTYDRTPRGRFELECIEMVIRHSRRWANAGGMSIFDYLDWVSDQLESVIREALPESDDLIDESVRISTVHGVKGLEFPIVLIAGMANGRRTNLPTISVKQNRVEFMFGKNKTVGYKQISEKLESADRDAEHARILYVAATRARDHLVYSSAAKVNKDGTTRSWSGLIREAVADTVSSDAAKRFDNYVPQAGDLPQTIEPKYKAESTEWLGKLDEIRTRSNAKNVVSPSSLKGQSPDDTEEEFYFVSEGQDESPRDYLGEEIAGADVASLGNAFHAVMEQIMLRRLDQLTQELNDVISSALDSYQATQHQARLIQMIEGVLKSTFLGRVFDADKMWPELAVSATNDEGEIVEGYADLVIQEGEELTIIDYKTNLELTKEKIGNYKVQLDAYSEILESATGLKVKQKLLWHVLPEKIEVISV